MLKIGSGGRSASWGTGTNPSGMAERSSAATPVSASHTAWIGPMSEGPLADRSPLPAGSAQRFDGRIAEGAAAVAHSDRERRLQPGETAGRP